MKKLIINNKTTIYNINAKDLLKNLNKISDNKNLIFRYVDSKRNYNYEDIYNYLKSKYNNKDKIKYPDYINKINSKKKEKIKKEILEILLKDIL